MAPKVTLLSLSSLPLSYECHIKNTHFPTAPGKHLTASLMGRGSLVNFPQAEGLWPELQPNLAIVALKT